MNAFERKKVRAMQRGREEAWNLHNVLSDVPNSEQVRRLLREACDGMDDVIGQFPRRFAGASVSGTVIAASLSA